MIDGLAGESAIGIRPEKERLLQDGLPMILHGLLAPGAEREGQPRKSVPAGRTARGLG